MSKGAVLSLKITGDASGAKTALQEVDNHAGILGGNFGKLAAVAGGAFAVDRVIDFGKEAFAAASNLEQMAGSVDAVFGKSAAQVDKLAAKAHDAVGLSTADYDQMAAVIGSQLKNAGVPMDQLAGKTDGLIKKGADMSAVFGGTAADAVRALSSVMKGEFDPIEKYGVSLNQSAINAELAARGQKGLTGAALKAATVQAALDIVTKQTAATQGQWNAQSDTAAEKQQKLGAKIIDVKGKLGDALLPVYNEFSGVLSDVAGFIGDNSHKVTVLAGVVGGLAVAVASVNAVSKVWAAGQKVVTAAQWAWNVAMDANPIGLIVLGVAALVGGVVLAYQKFKPFRDIVNEIGHFVGTVFTSAFEGAKNAVGWVVDKLKWIVDKGAAVAGFIGHLFGGGSSAGGAARSRGAVFGATRAAAPRLLGASSSSGGGVVGPAAATGGLSTGDTYNITVTGALDPAAVADQIAALLDRRARRIGLTVAGAR